MLPFATGAAGAAIETGASYVGSQFGFVGSNALGSLGAVSGDLLIILNFVGAASVTLSNGAAFTGSSGLGGTRVLGGADLSAIVSASASISLLIYRGATAAVQAVADGSAGDAVNRVAAGYTKHAQHKGQIGLITSTTGSTICSIAAPAAFAGRANASGGNLTDARLFVADRLYPVNPPYVSGTSFVWNTSGGSSNGLQILELRG